MTIHEDKAGGESGEELMEQDEAENASEVSDDLDYDDDEEEDEEEGDEEAEGQVTRRTYVPNVTQTGNDGDEEELECDLSAYVMYHKAETGYPCLSFDVLQDNVNVDASSIDKFPQTAYLVAGTQADNPQLNKLLVLKMENLNPIKKKKSQGEDDSDIEEDSDDEEDLPLLNCISVPHSGCVNRVRAKQIGDKTIAATLSELGVVHLWDLDEGLQAIEDPSSIAKFNKHYEKNPQKPIYSFTGHSDQGYAVDWSSTDVGTLATGDCTKHIFIWKLAEAGWYVDQIPLKGHTASVEDLQWSPNETNIMASCSVDRSICIWDVRTKSAPAMIVPDAHASDVNVISWNKIEKAFIVSGGDDGTVKVWDLRHLRPNSSSAAAVRPLATFKHHAAPITSVEWHPTDGTVFAASSDDNQITLWDLSVEADDQDAEVDQVMTEDDEAVNKLPPQLLFIHQGQKEVKELHWHPQLPGLMISTASSGFDIFRTISA